MKFVPMQARPVRRTVLRHDVLDLVGRVDQVLERVRGNGFSPVEVHEVIALTIARDRLTTKFRKMRDCVGELVTAQEELLQACSDIEDGMRRVSARAGVAMLDVSEGCPEPVSHRSQLGAVREQG